MFLAITDYSPGNAVAPRTPRNKKMNVREKEAPDQPWIEELLNERWGGVVVVHGDVFDPTVLPALIAGDREGRDEIELERRLQ
jgi:hypothetical protein